MIVHSLAVLIATAGLHAQAAPPSRPSQQPAASKSGAPACERPLVECAMLLTEQGQFEAAITTLRRLLATAPRDTRALNLLGIALTGAGRTQEASSRFREVLSVNPDFHAARKNLAVNEFNGGKLDAAERLFREVLAALPADEVSHVHLGEIHYARKQPDVAVRHYEQSGARATANPVWRLHYAESLISGRDTARAVSILSSLPKEDGMSHFAAGVALGRAGAYADAARHFGTARATYKDAYAAGYNQVLMLVEGGDAAAAVLVAEELFRANHRTGELYNLVSRAYVATNRIQDAYDALRTAARLEPTQEQHYLDLALICLDHDNFDLGMEILDIGLRYTPAAARLHLYRGVLLVMKGLVEDGEREFELARTLGPDGPVPYVALAMAWMQSGKTAKAVELLRQRVKAGGRDAILPYMFGIALLRSGVDPVGDAAAEAVHAFEDAIRRDPSLAGPRAELGKILLARGEVQAAIEHLDRATVLDPENPAPAYLLAQAYRRIGNTDRARELLARVSRLNAQGRGDDPDAELKRIVVRIVREGAAAPATR